MGANLSKAFNYHASKHFDCCRMNMVNVYVRTDPAEKIKMDKEKSTKRIDGAVALNLANRNNGTSDSVNNDRGIIVL